MFESISWQEFFNAGLYCVGGYYGVAVPLLYHKEIVLGIRRGGSQEASSTATTPTGSMMGTVRPDRPTNKQTITSDHVILAGVPSKEVFEAEQRETLLSDTAIEDVIAEIDGLIKITVDYNFDKTKVREFIGNVFLKFSMLSGSQRESVNSYIIREFESKCKIRFDLDTLQELWKSAE
jgi:hypothetical protein